MQEGRCIGCGALLDEESSHGVCKGCMTPERLEARVEELPEPFRSTFLQVGRDLGVLPK